MAKAKITISLAEWEFIGEAVGTFIEMNTPLCPTTIPKEIAKDLRVALRLSKKIGMFGELAATCGVAAVEKAMRGKK